MAKDFTAILNPNDENADRVAEWKEILGSDRVHIKSPIPTRGHLPGRGEAWTYELDLDLLTDDQRERLVQHLAEKFGYTAEEVKQALPRHGVPILADDITLSIANPQRWV
jgi:hypothetical protein